MHWQVAVVSRLTMLLRSGRAADFRYQVGQPFFVVGTLVGIALLDQSFKWWAWRNAAGVRVNYGGDGLVPATVGTWYTRPVSGALLDLLGSALLIMAVLLFVRRRRSTVVLIGGSLIIGGWSSNLLDRLVMHYWTAPGSVRGVVDFIPIDGSYYNVADLLIIFGTPLFILATTGRFLRRLLMKGAAVTAARMRPSTRSPRLVRTVMSSSAAVVALTAVVGAGVATFGGVTAPVTSASARYQPILVTHHGAAYYIS
jgi:lipoprotein signal peptidase